MASKYNIDIDKQVIYAYFQGFINESNCIDFLNKVTSDPKFKRPMATLMDLRNAEISSEVDVNKLSGMLFQQDKDLESKLAIVALHPMTVAKSMLMIQLRQGESKVFSEFENADAWLLR